jgi:type II secretory pathway pseudopilin PulG
MAVKRINASSIAEMVIALTIIAICFAIASQVFMQASRSTIQFKEVKEQTEFQSLLLEALTNDSIPVVKDWKGELGTIETTTTKKDSVTIRNVALLNDGRTIWQQTFFSEE